MQFFLFIFTPAGPPLLNPLSEFARNTQARWLWPTLALLMLIDVALVVVAGWGDKTLFWLEIILGLASFTGTTLLVFRLILVVNQSLNQARTLETQVREAVDAMPAGFAIYDEQDRLILCNKMIGEIFPHLKGQDITGMTYEQLIRSGVSSGQAAPPVPLDQFEDWLKKTLAERRKRTGPVLRAVPDGRWFHHYERLTSSQHLVVLRLDVSELIQKTKELELVNEKLARLSTTDGLTGIANRRLFDQTLLKEWQRSARSQQPLSLLLIDIDYFKRYNDRYGHLQGDECLRQVAGILEGCVKRSGELVARYGGEEFAILLPGADSKEATATAQRCADDIAKAKIMHADSAVSPWLTLSIGVVTQVAAQDRLPESLVKVADVALYSAKSAGRARYVVG